MKTNTLRRIKGFGSREIHRKKEPPAFHFLKQRLSFWVAALSVLAFVSGNMLGQHGWQVFWKSVLGKGDDSLIVYTGTVAPIDRVPDYPRWAADYGGDSAVHTFRQVPEDVMIPLPFYDGKPHDEESAAEGEWEIYSVGHLGAYDKEGDGTGSHPGVDIRVPVGTPVRSIANGIVDDVRDIAGYGQTVVIRHPNIPDPRDPAKTTTLYSTYAHLSAALVTEGVIVQKGETVALSGKSGNVTGPHLHFQIDREEAPWHPYWLFTGEEARSAGLTIEGAVNAGLFRSRGYTYTVNPLFYVQANYPPTSPTLVAGATEQVSQTASVVVGQRDPREQRLSRLMRLRSERLATRQSREPAQPASAATVLGQQTDVFLSASSSSSVASVPSATDRKASNVASVDIQNDGSFLDGIWEAMRITLLDAAGETVTQPVLKHDLVIRTAYGEAEIQPNILSELDFKDGTAEFQVLPKGIRTIVIQAFPFTSLSRPLHNEAK